MKKNFKRWIAFFMAFAMCLLCIPTDVFASTTVTWNGNFADEVPVDEYAYSFAVVGDTQAYVKLAPDKFNVLYDWILNNRVEQKIQFVMGLGDITDDNTPDQWAVAKEQIKRMDGYVPYSVILGNHDGYFGGVNDRTYFNQAFPYEEYEYTVDGAYTPAGAETPNMENTYQTFEAGGRDYLVLALNYAPDASELAWADGIAKAHPRHNVIVTTHGYLRYTSDDPAARDELELIDMGTTGSNQDANFNSALEIQNFVDANSNIVMVLCGHECYNTSTNPIGCRERTREDGSTVVEMLINPQVEDAAWNSRAGLVSMLYFSEDGKTVQVRYYSTTMEKYYTELSQFTITDMPVIEEEAKDAIFYEEYTDVSAYRSASGKTAPEYEGYLFAGWMKKDGDKYVPIKESEEITGSAYAKFVTEDVLQVKAQITSETGAETPSTNLRLVTTLDSEDYLQTGFVVTANGKTLTLPITDVYETITAKDAGDSVSYEPTYFCEESKLFATVIITEMLKQNYNRDFHVTPYWKTIDGTTVYGADRYVHVRDGYTDTVSANVHVDNEAELAAGMYYVTYDTENLDYLGYDAGDVFDTLYVAEVDETNGMIGFAGTLSDAGTSVKADGVLANINFVRTNGEVTDFTFETIGEQFCDAEQTALRFNVEDIEVTKAATAANVRPFMLMSLRNTEVNNLDLNITGLNFNHWSGTSTVPSIVYMRHDCADATTYSVYGLNGPYACDAITVNGETGVISSVLVMDNSSNVAIQKPSTYDPQEGDVIEIPDGAVATGSNGYQVTFATGIKLELVYNTTTEKLEWQVYQAKPTSTLDVELQNASFAGSAWYYFKAGLTIPEGAQYANTTYKTNKTTLNGKRVVTEWSVDANGYAIFFYREYTPQIGDILIVPQNCEAQGIATGYTDLGIRFTYGAKYHYDGTNWVYDIYYNEGTALEQFAVTGIAGTNNANSINTNISPATTKTQRYRFDRFILNGTTIVNGVIQTYANTSWVNVSIDSAFEIKPNDVLVIPTGTYGQKEYTYGSTAEYIKMTNEQTFIYNGTSWIVAKQYPSDATYEQVYVGNFNFRTNNLTVIRTESAMSLPSSTYQDKLYYTDEILVNGVRGIIDKVYIYSGGANIYVAGGSYTPAIGDVITIPVGARAVSTDGYYIQFGNGFKAKWNENLDLTNTGTPTNELTREIYYYDVSVAGFAYNGGKVDGVTYAFNMYLNMSSNLQSYLKATLSGNGWQATSDFVMTDSEGEHSGAINRFPLVLDSTKGMIAVLQSSYSDGFKPTNGAVLQIPDGAVITPENTVVYSGFVITEDYKVCYYNDQWCEDNAAPTIYYNNVALTGNTTIQVKEGYTADRLQACFTASDKVTGDNVTLSVAGLADGELTTGASATVTAQDIFGNKVSYVVTVEVKEAVTGDANDDDIVSVKDIVYFANWNKGLVGYEILKPTKRLSFMYDETAGTYDMTKLFTFILDSCKPEAGWL